MFSLELNLLNGLHIISRSCQLTFWRPNVEPTYSPEMSELAERRNAAFWKFWKSRSAISVLHAILQSFCISYLSTDRFGVSVNGLIVKCTWKMFWKKRTNQTVVKTITLSVIATYAFFEANFSLASRKVAAVITRETSYDVN